MNTTDQKSFEDRLAELEQLTQTLRAGKVPLNEAIAAFERGIELANGLEKELNQMQLRIERLLTPPTETNTPPELELFE